MPEKTAAIYGSLRAKKAFIVSWHPFIRQYATRSRSYCSRNRPRPRSRCLITRTTPICSSVSNDFDMSVDWPSIRCMYWPQKSYRVRNAKSVNGNASSSARRVDFQAALDSIPSSEHLVGVIAFSLHLGQKCILLIRRRDHIDQPVLESHEQRSRFAGLLSAHVVGINPGFHCRGNNVGRECAFRFSKVFKDFLFR